jgi:ABC-type Na+ efflux pump permease subunit
MSAFSWKRTLGMLAFGLALIGVWFSLLVNVALDEITRGSMVFFHATQLELVLATFVMLLGASIASIQVAAIIEELFGAH